MYLGKSMQVGHTHEAQASTGILHLVAFGEMQQVKSHQFRLQRVHPPRQDSRQVRKFNYCNSINKYDTNRTLLPFRNTTGNQNN